MERRASEGRAAPGLASDGSQPEKGGRVEPENVSPSYQAKALWLTFLPFENERKDQRSAELGRCSGEGPGKIRRMGAGASYLGGVGGRSEELDKSIKTGEGTGRERKQRAGLRPATIRKKLESKVQRK